MAADASADPQPGAQYRQSPRAAARRVPPWHRLAYIQRQLPAALIAAIQALDLRPGQRVLDYGCADRPYRAQIPAGVAYCGADLPGNAEADVAIQPDGRLPAALGGFDAVLSTQVLEHVEDPVRYLQECARVLAPGGRLLLSTHGLMVYHPDPVDLWRWTGAGLRCQIERAGFVVDSVQGVMGLAACGLQFFQDGLRLRLPRRLRAPFCYGMQKLVALADRLDTAASRERDALVYVVQARLAGPR
ncbi:MAG TPA: class I SAM-dependent methyltransferase [Nevskiaceae bacterium]|nr:class I SAM-dependent methyltransferase [Nevskiaceae bacterium]